METGGGVELISCNLLETHCTLARFGNNVVSCCRQCQDHLVSNIQQLITVKPNPIHSFEEVAADFCVHAGKITSSN